MHTLFFDTHTAILDPTTGAGVLVLPDPVSDVQAGQSFINLPARAAVWSWFGSDSSEYDTIIGQLAGISWELPLDSRGRLSWFDAGSTDCCGRSMIILQAVGPDVGSGRPRMVTASQQIQDLAAWTCCGMTALTEPQPQLTGPGDAA